MTVDMLETKRKETVKQKKVAWGITGAGDRLAETLDVMKQIEKEYRDKVEIYVYLSKAAEQVLKYYRLYDDLRANFDRFWVEINANSPFLAGLLQTGKFEFLLIAPATSNTVAKIAVGISDTMLSNAAIMALKAFVPVYLMPTDYKEGPITTKLPDKKGLKLRIRKEDAENAKKLAAMKDVFVLEKPEDIAQVFKMRFKWEAKINP
ncbi:MAG: archaeoflavoprotein AfpA [Candidatus Bathyarchaeia archaeon]|jgi:archaeoflavoprotein AfpA|nr:archaeoflavoprotein AfpA [Candidatus Bathyarchaeota archaeon]